MALAREVLGGNGIIYDNVVARHFLDMEAAYTYEGTYEVNALYVTPPPSLSFTSYPTPHMWLFLPGPVLIVHHALGHAPLRRQHCRVCGREITGIAAFKAPKNK